MNDMEPVVMGGTGSGVAEGPREVVLKLDDDNNILNPHVVTPGIGEGVAEAVAAQGHDSPIGDRLGAFSILGAKRRGAGANEKMPTWQKAAIGGGIGLLGVVVFASIIGGGEGSDDSEAVPTGSGTHEQAGGVQAIDPGELEVATHPFDQGKSVNFDFGFPVTIDGDNYGTYVCRVEQASAEDLIENRPDVAPNRINHMIGVNESSMASLGGYAANLASAVLETLTPVYEDNNFGIVVPVLREEYSVSQAELANPDTRFGEVRCDLT